MALKEEILKLLNEDEEFRRQIENILGLNVIKTINELAQNVNSLWSFSRVKVKMA
ncbi:hypothetical protein V6M85_02885 [Sulfolobus tengchongensis]|uniref:Uncharacterized protein n=1 Tax=Sulfolobus tengchongensis TaxID=207809 RepID=A0AAX4L349_9CREN